ncbi:3-hydroxyacyl-CoA dehydrogenase family protein [Saccharothrix deserti]|uniref:3-hydroxyacyl-CoA dehydrogenase family protein n=1 Tax=Saccharothrix deserti TaxID=2593674 RepID=UPI00192E6485|nr:3-hydroxyacyl-CoA dehydrogenase family protein [Saccharothrix deserti]
MTADHRPLAIVGAGVLGTGLATLAIGRGVDVVLVDSDRRAVDTAGSRVSALLRLARLTGALPTGTPDGALTATDRLADVAVARAVVESVPEHLPVKAAVLAEVARMAAPDALLGSTTSGIPVDDLADRTGRPADLVGLHFMNPPTHIRAVEVVRGPRTAEATMRAATSLLDALGCTAVVVGDGPGFVVNRVLQRMINEASRIVQEGLATPEVVDTAFTDCLGHRTGPLATADLIGLDNVVDSLTVLHERLGGFGYQPSDLLLAKVRAGDLGRKSGRGFFTYPGPA